MLSQRLKTAMAAAGVTQAELARACGVSAPSVNGWLSGKAKFLKGQNLLAAAKALGVSQTWLATGTGSMKPGTPIEVSLDDNPDYPSVRRVKIKANAGVQGYHIEQDIDDGDPIVFRKSWFEKHGYKPERLLAVKVCGESMEPTFWAEDLIVVNTESNQPKDRHVFLVVYEGETGVKRLERDEGTWWLASDNADQRRFKRKRCHEDTEIIGEVVYKQSERF